jgi:hypothetical protein
MRRVALYPIRCSDESSRVAAPAATSGGFLKSASSSVPGSGAVGLAAGSGRRRAWVFPVLVVTVLFKLEGQHDLDGGGLDPLWLVGAVGLSSVGSLEARRRPGRRGLGRGRQSGPRPASLHPGQSLGRYYLRALPRHAILCGVG